MKTNSHLFTHLAKSASGRKLIGRKVAEKNVTRILCSITRPSLHCYEF
jgi:hypothetical protein